MMATRLSVLGIFLFSFIGLSFSQSFKVDINTDGTYTVKINDTIWLRSAPSFFNKDHQKWSTDDFQNNSLVLQSISYRSDMNSRRHKFNETSFHYTFGNTSNVVIASIKVFPDDKYILFTQTYLTAADNTSLNDVGVYNQTIAGFPNFQVTDADEPLGFLSYGGYMFGDTDKTTGTFSSTTNTINDGMPGGPLVMFNKAGNSIIISPYDNYMAASLWHDGKPGGRVGWGIMGGVNNIPANFTYSTILAFDTTIKKTFFNWGNRLFERFDLFKLIHRGLNVRKDESLNYLGYWTDNGAYYYYNTEANKTYEDTIKDVKTYALQQNIPFKYLQLDSWWYPKDSVYNATTNWVARPDYFPHGFKNLSEETGWKFVAHNRYWSKLTPYAKQNNGSFDWVIGEFGSLPNDISFWRYLFKQAKDWGLMVYEQDWLNVQTQKMAALQNSLTLGRDWLTQMGQAAAENGLTIQYCMANARHALQSIEIPVVTQGRTSDDYLFRRPKQWKIGVASLFANAVKVLPYKDTFWTSSKQPGNPYGKSEPYPALEAVVSSLSKGPVGPSDRIGSINRDLLMRCCSEDGRLLKASSPAMPIDKQLITDAFEASGQSRGEIWMAQSFVKTNGADREYGILFAADIKGQMSVTINDLHFNVLTNGIYYPYNNVKQWKMFNSSTVIDLSGCTEMNFCLYYFSPILNNSLVTAILGEDNKWIPMSPQRINNILIDQDTEKVSLNVTGAPGETVNLSMLFLNQVLRVNCTLPPFQTTKTCEVFSLWNSGVTNKSSLFNFFFIFMVLIFKSFMC